jgi:hypothetical protein
MFMKNYLPASCLLAALLVGTATAAEDIPYGQLFATPPCSDGWMGCVVAGAPVDAGAVTSASGMPMSASMRIDWWTLQPTASLSPFGTLSSYSGAIGQLAMATPPPAQNTPPPVADTPTFNNTPPPLNNTPPPLNNTPPPLNNTPPPLNNTPTPSARSTPPLARTPTPVPVFTPPPATPTPKAAFNSNTPTPTPTTTSIKTTAPTSPGDNSCDDLAGLEPTALMGQLSSGQVTCLENRISTEAAQTTRDKVSRLLVNTAYAKGDKAGWARLVKRHLEEIDRSDPDMCYNYALHLSRQGAGVSSSVIRWADYALENKSKWQGNTYKSRVYALLKMKAEAASRLWESAEKEYNESRSEEAEAKATKYRGMAKEYAREWLDYARASGQDTSTAMSLCVSAAGNQAFCQGG